MLSEASYHNMTVGRIPSVEGGIQPTLLTTKGDIIVATGNATLVRQGVGTDGQVLTAHSAQADGVIWATPGGPAFSAYRATSAQTFTQSTFVKVQLNAEFFDTDGCFDSTTNYRFTPTTAGKYQINFAGIMAAGTAARVIWAVYKNGTSFVRFYDDTPVSTAAQSSGAVMIEMNGSTDYLELYAYSASTGANSDYYSGGTGTIFSGSWIRS
jgi:hypothetical protein